MSDSQPSNLIIKYTEKKLNDWNVIIIRALIIELIFLLFLYFIVNIYEIFQSDNNWFSEDKDNSGLTTSKKAEKYNDDSSNKDDFNIKQYSDNENCGKIDNETEKNYTFGPGYLSESRKNPESNRNSHFSQYLQHKNNLSQFNKGNLNNIQSLEAQSEKNIRNESEVFGDQKPDKICPSFNKLEDPLAGKFVIGGGTPPGLSPKFKSSFNFDIPENNNDISNVDLPEADITKGEILVKQDIKEEITKQQEKIVKINKCTMELREEIGYHVMYHTICLSLSIITWANVVTVILTYLYLINFVLYIYYRIRQNKKSKYAYLSMFFLNFWLIFVSQFRANLS